MEVALAAASQGTSEGEPGARGPGDVPREACGVFGIFGPDEDVARTTSLGLLALQHRGEESAGIATADGEEIRFYNAMGLVSQVFSEDILRQLEGHIAIGHNRYSTTGSSRLENAQPVHADGPLGRLMVAHNGNLTNAENLRRLLEERGYELHSTTDSELIAQFLAHAPGEDWPAKIRAALPRFVGSYSLALMTRDLLIGVRDPLGNRPLCLGRREKAWVLASESCALEHIGAQFLREVEPGEIVVISERGVAAYQGPAAARRALCLFEYIYLARPDSVIQNRLVYLARQEMGRALAREHPADAELVMGVPETAIPAAQGFAQESGLPYRDGLVRNRYFLHRTFIQPDPRSREAGVRLKFNPLPEVVKGQRIVVVDDSIVRGTTTQEMVGLLRRCGAREVHLRICAPPLRHPCFLGVDIPTYEELIAHRLADVEAVREHIGADSLGYLSLEGCMRAVGLPAEGFCTACFSGDYPMPVQFSFDKLALERPGEGTAAPRGTAAEAGEDASEAEAARLTPTATPCDDPPSSVSRNGP